MGTKSQIILVLGLETIDKEQLHLPRNTRIEKEEFFSFFPLKEIFET
jgi:hypothetical protein